MASMRQTVDVILEYDAFNHDIANVLVFLGRVETLQAGIEHYRDHPRGFPISEEIDLRHAIALTKKLVSLFEMLGHDVRLREESTQ